jgi:hypothetical protein
MPMIPTTPASAGGAGIGSLNRAKINPTAKPVISDSRTIFIVFLLGKLMLIHKYPLLCAITALSFHRHRNRKNPAFRKRGRSLTFFQVQKHRLVSVHFLMLSVQPLSGRDGLLFFRDFRYQALFQHYRSCGRQMRARKYS